MKISVVVPSYNQAAFLPTTLDSILEQKGNADFELEVLVYDGGSTDGSLEVLRRYEKRHGFKWISQPDHGQTDAINQGLAEATGDLLAYLNSDDVYYPGTLERVHDYFLRHPECLVLYGQADYLDEKGEVIRTYGTKPWSYPHLLEDCFLCQPATFWRREVIERWGLFDDSLHFAMDYEYWLRVGQHVDFHYLEGQKLAGSRLHDACKTVAGETETLQVAMEVVARYNRKAPLTWLKHVTNQTLNQTLGKDVPVQVRKTQFAAKVLELAKKLDMNLDVQQLVEVSTLIPSPPLTLEQEPSSKQPTPPGEAAPPKWW